MKMEKSQRKPGPIRVSAELESFTIWSAQTSELTGVEPSEAGQTLLDMTRIFTNGF